MTRALLLVAGWVAQAMAAWLILARQRPLAAEIVALRERLEKLRAENDLLRARLERIDPHARPHYRPSERLHILLHRARYGLSIEATARAFVITGHTVVNWLKEIESGVARLVQARKPMNALPDLVREIAFFIKREWPRWGTRRIAGILAGMGLKASRTSVQRVLRRPPPRRPATGRRGRACPIHARHRHHVWVVDLTEVRSFFRSVVVGAVLDAFTRKVLALRVWAANPESSDLCLLVREALRGHARPTWLVSDRGTQFTSRRFRYPETPLANGKDSRRLAYLVRGLACGQQPRSKSPWAATRSAAALKVPLGRYRRALANSSWAATLPRYRDLECPWASIY